MMNNRKKQNAVLANVVCRFFSSLKDRYRHFRDTVDASEFFQENYIELNHIWMVLIGFLLNAPILILFWIFLTSKR